MRRTLLAIILVVMGVGQTLAAVPPVNVVRIFVEDKDNTQSAGTGSLVRPNLVITNWHVVKDRAGTVRVLFPDWSVSEATVIKMDRKWDLAALRIKPVRVPPIVMGRNLAVGDVIVVGGYGSGWYVTDIGSLTAFYQPDEKSPKDLINVDAVVRSGDSGGPMLRGGELIGVLFGCSDGTYGTHINRVRKFLKSIE